MRGSNGTVRITGATQPESTSRRVIPLARVLPVSPSLTSAWPRSALSSSMSCFLDLSESLIVSNQRSELKSLYQGFTNCQILARQCEGSKTPIYLSGPKTASSGLMHFAQSASE